MTHLIQLDLPPHIYVSLLEAAERQGTSLEAVAMNYLAVATQANEPDPIEKWIGALESNSPGWSDRHDQFIGGAELNRANDVGA